MRILLDTHILIWLIMDDDRLSSSEKRLIFHPETVALASSVSIWEVRLKQRRDGRRPRDNDMPIDPETTLRSCERLGLEVVSATAEDFTILLDPPLPHRDPFDDMLMVHAQRSGARLLTQDDHMIDHPIAYRP